MSEEGVERIYTVPLKGAWVVPRTKRTPKAVKVLREFVKRHMKPTRVIITNEVNEEIWKRGMKKPPRYIKVRVVKDAEGVVTVSLAREVDRKA